MKRIAYALSLLFIFVIPWENSIEVRSVGTISRLLGLIAAGSWLVAVVVEGNLRRPGLYTGLVAAFVAWSAISVFWSIDPESTSRVVWTYAQLLVFIYLLWDLYRTPSSIRTALQTYTLGSFVAVASILINLTIDHGRPVTRFTAEGFNADTAGLILAIGMPVAWALGMLQVREHRGGMLRWLNFSYMPLAFLGIALTATRTALIATVPAILFAIASLGRLSVRRRIVISLFAIAGVLAIIPLIPQTSVERFLTTGSEISSGALGGRGYIWKMGLRTYAEHPILGVGAGAFKVAVGIGKVAHNTLISVLVELGLVGISLFLAILGVALAQAFKHPPWGVRFWLTLYVIWLISASSLTWELRKQTWLVLTLIVASGAVQVRRRPAASASGPSRLAADPELLEEDFSVLERVRDSVPDSS